MISIGNDIVDLSQTNFHRTVQEKFYSKILCADEIQLFKNKHLELSFEHFVWLAWSVKESVYKFVKRHNHQTVFSPSKIIVQTITEPLRKTKTHLKTHEGISFNKIECFCCQVLYNNTLYYARSFANSHFIFTVAVNTDCFENIFWGIQNIDTHSSEAQSNLVRTFVLERLKQQLGNDNLRIEKASAGFPFIVPYQHIPLSLTHHGNFVAYSFMLFDVLIEQYISGNKNIQIDS